MLQTLAQAKRDFQIGYLKDFEIKRWPKFGQGWFLLLGNRVDGWIAGPGAGWLVDARTKQPREFKSLDSAVSCLETIGFEVQDLVRL